MSVSTSFTGVAPIKGVISPGSTRPAIVTSFTTASLTAFENNSAAAATALADVTTARNLINSLTGTTTTAEIGGKTFTSGASSTIYSSVLGLGEVYIGASFSIINNAVQVQPTPPPIPTPTPTFENLQTPLVSEISPVGRSFLHIVLHNLIPGQSVKITSKSVNP